MANTQEEVELSDGISAPSMGMLPGMEERFSFKTLLFPDNSEPSTLSGFAVNICASAMGRWSLPGLLSYSDKNAVNINKTYIPLQER